MRLFLRFFYVFCFINLFFSSSFVYAADADWYQECWIKPSSDTGSTLILAGSSGSKLVNASKSACLNMFLSAIPEKYVPDGKLYDGRFPQGYFVKDRQLSSLAYKGCSVVDGRNVCSYAIQGTYGYEALGKWNVITGQHFGLIHLFGPLTEPPKQPCETPKTDDQCNKGASSWVEGNAAFWASAGASGTGYKGCTFEKVPDGLGFKFPDGSESHTVKSTGSTGKSWCETTPSEPPVPESEFPNNPNLTPATDPKECKSGWIKTSTGQYYCVASGAEPTPPSTNPDGSINSDKDGNPSPPDANAGKPGDGSGSGGGGGDGGDGGGECEGEDCEGGGGGTKPPARPDDPWSSVLDANDLSQLQADKADVEAELNSFYEQVRNSIRINIGSPSTAPMPSYGFIEQGGERVELSMSWLDSVDMEGRSAVILLCGLIAASIIFWGRP